MVVRGVARVVLAVVAFVVVSELVASVGEQVARSAVGG
jgi:hypothetical protein